MREKSRYVVRLEVPLTAWALVEVEASCEEDATLQAYLANKAGTVDYEYTRLDNSAASVTNVEEVR